MKQAPLWGLRCFPRDSTGSMSGKCGRAFDIANLPGLSDVTRPVCADTALAASMPQIRRLSADRSRAAAVRCPLQGSACDTTSFLTGTLACASNTPAMLSTWQTARVNLTILLVKIVFRSDGAERSPLSIRSCGVDLEPSRSADHAVCRARRRADPP